MSTEVSLQLAQVEMDNLQKARMKTQKVIEQLCIRQQVLEVNFLLEAAVFSKFLVCACLQSLVLTPGTAPDCAFISLRHLLLLSLLIDCIAACGT